MALTEIPIELSSTPSIVDGGNATAITIDSSENVGIGTSSPRSILDLDGGSETQLRLQTNNSGSTTSDGLLVSLDSSANAKAYIWNYENAEMIFGTNATERMRIDSSGNVGIGTNNPVSFGANTAGLTVNGSSGSHITWQNNGTNVAFAYPSGNDFIIGSEQVGSNTIFTAAGAERMRIASDGNVGIGTTAPDAHLHANSGAAGIGVKLETSSGQFTVQGSDAGGTYIEQTGTTAATRKFRLQNQDGSNNYTQLIIDGANQRIEVIPGLDVHKGAVWSETAQGTGKGTIHLDPTITTDHAGSSITFGASDAGNGQTTQAGIYTRTDGSYGSKMYLATTDGYGAGSKTGLSINHLGNVTVPRGYLAAKQPAAIARGVGGWQTSYTATGWNELHNLVAFTQYNNSVGTPWSNSTGRFTAPIAGYYLCSMSIYANNTTARAHGTTYIHPQWAKNGNVNIHGDTPYQIYGHDATAANSYPDGISRTDIVYCAANDYITAQVYIYGANWQIYRSYTAISFCLLSAS